MPAIVRVKRRIDEEPLSAFLLNGKKRRVEDGAEGSAAIENITVDNKEGAAAAIGTNHEISTKLKFVGTINKQNDTTEILRLSKTNAKDIIQAKIRNRIDTSHRERTRNEQRATAHEQRFRVVNCMRTTLEAEPAEVNANNASESDVPPEASKELTIVDIEKDSGSLRSGALAMESQSESAVCVDRPSDSDTGYVYDLYYPENEQLVDDVDLMDGYLSVLPVQELVYDNMYAETDDSNGESDDSNQENYYTNDYPDEDDNFSEDSAVEDLTNAITGFILDNRDEDEEERYVECSSDDDEAGDVRDNCLDCFYDSLSDAEDKHNANKNSSDDEDTEDFEDRYHSASENGDN